MPSDNEEVEEVEEADTQEQEEDETYQETCIRNGELRTKDL